MKTRKQEREILTFYLKSQGIVDKNVLNALLEVPRENFVLKENKDYAYLDSALPICALQSISQPFVVAYMTQMLNLDEYDLVLEIGTGSGYQSAILSKIVSKVISYEIIPELCNFAKNNLKQSKIDNVVIKCIDGSDVQEENYFDKAIITTAIDKVPISIIKSLKEGGVIVLPEGDLHSQRLTKYVKSADELKLVMKSISVRFVPFSGRDSLV
ncbi:MAG: protein-L-isoaspartate(D-aspartate) O-methyltransferase [Candidatus Woesearchaeota archaeon]|jgi:protein-L-isoaspartate(D-aspartate) O-methyltransferase|nr:protein-L-isoaspartate(D-aspartate) O-methyltransferase [Candidatus Woesearchaeota archaeon]